MSEKIFCYECDELVDTGVRKGEETFEVKDRKVSIKCEVRYCKKCGIDLFDKKLDSANLINAYDEYKKAEGMLTSREIKEIRSRYGLTQTSFAKILGLGEKTIARYENGSIQDKSQDNLILLVRDKNAFKTLWNKNKYLLKDEEFSKTESIFGQIEQSDSEMSLRLNIPANKLIQFSDLKKNNKYPIESLEG